VVFLSSPSKGSWLRKARITSPQQIVEQIIPVPTMKYPPFCANGNHFNKLTENKTELEQKFPTLLPSQTAQILTLILRIAPSEYFRGLALAPVRST
jgi:hypothetical protein